MMDHNHKTITKDRRVTERYILTDPTLEYNEHGDSMRPALEVTTTHNKDRGMLVTSFSRVMVSPQWVRVVMELGKSNECPVTPYVGAPIARYSAKALNERHTAMLAMAEPHMESLLEWASEAKH